MNTPNLIRPPDHRVLEGPLAEITIGEVHLEIWVRVGFRDRFNPKRHPKMLREAADMRPPNAPNPCLVLLDPDSDGNAYVYGKITVRQ